MVRAFAILLVLLTLAPQLAAADDRLFAAISVGDSAAIKRELANGANVDGRARDQATPLIAAALASQFHIVELLLGSGADVMARNSGGFTALHAAAYSGSVPIAELLLEKGALLDDADNKAGVTPMMVAGEENRLAVAELLIAKGANVSHPEVHGYTPITRALFKGNSDIIRLYKRHGATCQVKIVAWYQQCLEIHD
ncbi:ankyrin repeat domain-containing protein [Cypionkella psychrotolerans]|uniref:ankyrin repeat domain-containing protein n=1 Tax=Cypionkella psychrotolerans TaxID=1678131 RepID=UPI0006B62E01|nr:ankyrin repeat domain-containing protein [Cypionkella psychrotolerans]